MFVAMANRVLLSFFVLLASVAVGQAERVQMLGSDWSGRTRDWSGRPVGQAERVQRLGSDREAVGSRNDDIADRGRGDRINGQPDSFRVEDLEYSRENYRAQDNKDEYRTQRAGEQQIQQDRRILDQTRSGGRQDDPSDSDPSRNDRRSYTNEESSKRKRRIDVDDEVSLMKENRRDGKEKKRMEPRRKNGNAESLPRRKIRRNQHEELVNNGESPRNNGMKRLNNESTIQSSTYLSGKSAQIRERSNSQDDEPVSNLRSVISDGRQSGAIEQDNSNNDYSVDRRIDPDTGRPSRQRERRVYTNDEGRTSRPTTEKRNSEDEARNEKYDRHDPQVIQVLRRIQLLPDQEGSSNHEQQEPNLRRNLNVVKSQRDDRLEDLPSQKRKFEALNSRGSGDSHEGSEGRSQHSDREIRYDARMVSEDLNGRRGRDEGVRRNRKLQPQTHVFKEEELNARKERIWRKLKNNNDQQRKVPDRSDQLRNYGDALVTTGSANAKRSNAVRSLESKNAQRNIAEPIPDKIIHAKLKTGSQHKSLVPLANPLLNDIVNLQPLPIVQLSSSKHRAEQPSQNRRVHEEEVFSQSIKVPSLRLEPPVLPEPLILVSRSVPVKKTSQRSNVDHRERHPAGPISSSSKNPPSKIIHQSRGSASRKSKKPYRDQRAKGGQQVAHVAQKPLYTAATDKGPEKGKKKGKGHHKSHKSSHKKAEGHKGDKGHYEKKGHKKIHKGNYDKKHKQDHHDKGGVFHMGDHHDEHNHGEYEKGKKGTKGYKKGKKMHHHKGHKDKGFKATHHIKEFMVNKKHYEDVDDKEYQGEHDHFDKFFDDFKKGMFKAGSFKGDEHHDKHDKKGHHKKGHHDHHDKGHEKHHGHDGHHGHHEEHGHDKGHHEKHGHDDHGHR